ncbi:MAG: selenocysteine-specific translation elongation factor, partial [Chloroflexi bacterium]
MHVVGTAGHIDHGKSTLVRRITGIDPDRLPEEKRRGMTIDLGFAPCTLPSGKVVSIVDVPGHERFVKTMVAGASGIELALVVVAADEGVMQQTIEHLGILSLLDVRQGVVAVTKADLVDGELLRLVVTDAKETIRGTRLETSPIVPVSAVSGFGIEDLLATLDEALTPIVPRNTTAVPFLGIDRAFTVRGFGTVVTGTLHSGSLSTGDDIEVIPGARRGRIRGLHVHGEEVTALSSPARVAVNLTGIATREVARGDVLSRPTLVAPATSFSARLEVLRDAPASLKHDAHVMVHVGAAERKAVLSILDARAIEPGGAGWAHIRLAQPVGVMPRQRFILRLPAPLRTIAGGQIFDVNVRRPRLVRKATARLDGLVAPDAVERVTAALGDGQGHSTEELAIVTGLDPVRLPSILQEMQTSGTVKGVAGEYRSMGAWQNLRRWTLDTVSRYHRTAPLQLGMPMEQLRRGLRRSDPGLALLVSELQEEGLLVQRGRLLALAAHVGGSVARDQDTQRIVSALNERPFSPPPARELLRLSGADEALLTILVEEGRIVRVDGDLFFAREAWNE